MLADGGQRVVVQADLGVGEVVVVDQHQVGRRVADQVGHLRAGAGDVELHAGGARESVRALAVQPHRKPVVAQHRVLGDRRLLDDEALVPPVVGQLEERGLFLLKDAVEVIALALGVTRFTIYNYLNELAATEKS